MTGKRPKVNIFLANNRKNITLPQVYRAEFNKLVAEKYANWLLIYTDDSKSDVGMRSVAVSESVVKKASFPPVAAE